MDTHRRSDGAPAPVLRRHGPRVGPRPSLSPAPAAGAGSGGAGEVPFVAHLRHAAEHEATKAHRLLALGVLAKDAWHARGPNSAAGRRGRRRSADRKSTRLNSSHDQIPYAVF